MCGRFTLHSSPRDIADLFGIDPAQLPELTPRYNISPTQAVAAVRLDDHGRRAFATLRWGLIPSWTKDHGIGNSLINARADTVASKPAFRAPFRRRRCLVPASGFYEWKATGGKYKQPFHLRIVDGRPFAIAGLWERWAGAESGAVETCAVLTTDANEVVREVHNRMPVILAQADFAAWLDPRTPAQELLPLLRPYPAEAMTASAVGRYVSNPRNEGPQCLAP
jgi:putative SOS response-associated peptidase YedK